MEGDDLYILPPERFVPERAALVRVLRAAGRRAEAGEVAGLRKPSVAAWAVNQLVRTQGEAVAELFAAGDALRAAQASLLAGKGDGRALRDAARRERDAVDALVASARGLLTSSDGGELSASAVERVSETLHAAALDEDARAQVRDGRLARELRHAGLGVGDGGLVAAAAPAAKRTTAAGPKASTARGAPVTPAPKSKPARPPASARAAKAGPARRAESKRGREPEAAPAGPSAKQRAAAAAEQRERLAKQRAEAQRSERERKAARVAVRVAGREAERTARAVGSAQARRDRAAETLAEADAVLEAAEQAAHAAAEAHARAQAELRKV
jgi:hypothetical protein